MDCALPVLSSFVHPGHDASCPYISFSFRPLDLLRENGDRLLFSPSVIPASFYVIPVPLYVIPVPLYVIPVPLYVIPAKAGIYPSCLLPLRGGRIKVGVR